jgi:hypothetical protein
LKKNSPSIWSKAEEGEGGRRNSCSVLSCRSHLVDIFTWGRSDLVFLLLNDLEFALVARKMETLPRLVLLDWSSFTLCVFVTRTLVW